MATMVKCTRIGGEIIHINFDYVFQLARLPAKDDEPERTEVAMEDRMVYVIDDPESLARSANDLK